MRSQGVRNYIKDDAWGVYDVLACLFCFVALGLHILLFITGAAIEAAIGSLAASSSSPSSPIIAFHSLASTVSIIESVACIIVFIRCLKFSHAFPVVSQQLRDAVAVAAAASKRMISAVIMFIVITFAFASAACAAFGATLQQWSTVWDAVRALLTMLFGRCAFVGLVCLILRGGYGDVGRFGVTGVCVTLTLH